MSEEGEALMVTPEERLSEERLPVPSVNKPLNEFRNEFEVGAMLQTSGQVVLTDKEKEILYASVNEQDVEIRPDGLIYLPWMEYVTRLKGAFGMEWSIIPQGMPKVRDTMIMWGFWLVVRGCLMGYAIGEQEYYPGNRTMSYSDACEGAKSNALMRLCKGVGISLELWKPSFIREWKQEYAETYLDKGKTRWRKKPVPKIPQTTGTTDKKNTPHEEDSILTPLGVEVEKLFHDFMVFYNRNVAAVKEVLESQTKKSSFKELDEFEVKALRSNLETLKARLKVDCSGEYAENKCGHCAIHFDSSFEWCSFDEEDTTDDLICPLSLLKKGE